MDWGSSRTVLSIGVCIVLIVAQLLGWLGASIPIGVWQDVRASNSVDKSTHIARFEGHDHVAQASKFALGAALVGLAASLSILALERPRFVGTIGLIATAALTVVTVLIWVWWARLDMSALTPGW